MSRGQKELLIIFVVTLAVFFFDLLMSYLSANFQWDREFPFSIVSFEAIGIIGISFYAWKRWKEARVLQNDKALLQENIRKVREVTKRYRSFAEAVIKGQEEERVRLARDLHDDTIHRLILVGQQVQVLRLDLGDNPVTEDLTKTQELIDQTIDHIRRFIRELRPTYLEKLGLIPAIDALVKDIGNTDTLSTRFRKTGKEYRLSGAAEIALYRIAQEALRNIRNHSEAKRAEVCLNFTSFSATLSICDNGKGFDLPNEKALFDQGNFGLLGMRERAEISGGSFQIQSVPGKGTRIDVKVLNVATNPEG